MRRVASDIALAHYREMPEVLVAAMEAKLTPDMREACQQFAVKFPL